MAFNIMDMFGPVALNRMLQPQFTGQPNMLERPMAPPLPPPVAVGPAPGMNMPQPQAPQPDPMQTAAVQPAPQSAPAVPEKPGGLEKYTSDMFMENLNEFFIGMMMGKNPGESLAMGALNANKKHNGMKNANHTVAWLQSKGLGKEEAWQIAQNPTVLSEYLKNMITPADPMKALQLQKTQLEIANMQNPQAKLTDDQREYQAAKDQGFNGSFMDYMVKMKEAGRQQVNIDTGVKLPSGYQWVDPNDQSKGVQPIAGGPATQIPGELAARVGMGENFLTNDLPFLRQQENLEAATGPLDRAAAWAGYGKPAEIQRKFQSGVEVLSRLLSGAGMTQIEVDEKTKRYMPTITDTPESLKTKLNQLEAEIRAAGDAAMRGRGGSISQQPQGGGVVDYRQYFGGQ